MMASSVSDIRLVNQKLQGLSTVVPGLRNTVSPLITKSEDVH